MSKIIKPGVTLLIVAAAAAFILGLVNMGTAGRIEALAIETMENAMQTVLPADSYTDLGVEDDGEINSVHTASNGGWVVEVTETGSQGTITMMVGVSADYACTGISITDSSETAGLGAIASQSSDKGDAFRAQFVGQSGTVSVDKDGGEIDSITGATITSRAVCTGVTAAISWCEMQSGASAEVNTASAEASNEASADPSAELG